MNNWVKYHNKATEPHFDPPLNELFLIYYQDNLTKVRSKSIAVKKVRPENKFKLGIYKLDNVNQDINGFLEEVNLIIATKITKNIQKDLDKPNEDFSDFDMEFNNLLEDGGGQVIVGLKRTYESYYNNR